MSDPNCRSDAQVELATAIGTWLGPILGAIATVLMANVLEARSKKFTPAASDLESSTSDRCSGLHQDMTADIVSVRQELERIVASQDAQQKQIDCLTANGGESLILLVMVKTRLNW
ncbi:hypothetical protein N7457_003759 [Penicillium paradoxum]|uniref:uncharacterized protein n=1 Tax=Penicillium paradoxum TaxID=176176 RepID=UPI0025479D69|nr:uncharacterized protein N7457_003759 [Penicillium paradoxum]KAJ5788769.1 hypothetical protein N7457_003759 [Penicillium paradoxum]